MNFLELSDINKDSKSFKKLAAKNEYPIFKYFKDKHIKELKREIINSSKQCKYKNRIDDIDFSENSIIFKVTFVDFEDYNDSFGEMQIFAHEFLKSSFYGALKKLGLSFIIYTYDVPVVFKPNILFIEICVKDIYI